MTMDCPSAYAYDGAPYQSPAQIQAWAASASGDLVDQQMLNFQNGLSLPIDEQWSTGAPPMPGYLSHSNSSDGSDPVNSVPMLRSHGSMYHGHATDMTNYSQSGSSTGYPVSQGLGFEMLASHGDHSTMDIAYPLDGRPFPEDEVAFSLSPNEQTFFPGEVRNTLDSNQGFLTSPDSQNMRSGSLDDAYYHGWNDINVEHSVSSSLSSQIPGTPTSLPLEHWEDSGLGARPSLVDGSSQLPSSMMPFSDVTSTVRPLQGSHRSPLPEQWMQSPTEVGGQVYGSPISTFASSRRSSEGEPLSARRHPLYQLKPRKDGYYKCVFLDDEKACDHEPFKLKCNYDKHLDSHLKPYRCKQRGCAENPFSSTACLLRHEREAHGMHNHKEVLCKFKECERSLSGKGFPRKWNAHDHMKRVHRYIAPEDSTSNSGEVSSPSASSMDLSFSEAPTLVGSSTTKRRISDAMQFPVNPTTRKTKSSAKPARGVGHNAAYAPQSSRGQRFTEQDVLLDRRCAQPSHAVSDWTAWHSQCRTAV